MTDEKILIEFFDGFLSEKEQENIKSQVSPHYPVAFWETQSTPMNAAFDDIFTTLTVYITPGFWTQFFAGLAVATVIECVKSIALLLKRSVQCRKVYKQTSKSVREKNATIGIKANNVNIILPTDISDEKFKYCVDKAFESVNTAAFTISEKETITYFDSKTDKIVTYTMEEYYWNVVDPRNKKEVNAEHEATI